MIDERDLKIQQLEEKVAALSKEKQELEDTVQWMHDLIWKLMRERET